MLKRISWCIYVRRTYTHKHTQTLHSKNDDTAVVVAGYVLVVVVVVIVVVKKKKDFLRRDSIVNPNDISSS